MDLGGNNGQKNWEGTMEENEIWGGKELKEGTYPAQAAHRKLQRKQPLL